MSQVTTFITPHSHYLLHVEKEKKRFIGEEVNITPAKLIKFENGMYATESDDEIEKIRESNAFKSGVIRELKSEDEKKFGPEPSKVFRGPVDSKDLATEAGEKLEEKAKKEQVMAGLTKCPDCGKEFDKDLSGRKLRMHRLSHRKEKAKK